MFFNCSLVGARALKIVCLFRYLTDNNNGQFWTRGKKWVNTWYLIDLSIKPTTHTYPCLHCPANKEQITLMC